MSAVKFASSSDMGGVLRMDPRRGGNLYRIQRQGNAIKGGVSRMDSRRGINLSRIQRQGFALSCTGVLSHTPPLATPQVVKAHLCSRRTEMKASTQPLMTCEVHRPPSQKSNNTKHPHYTNHNTPHTTAPSQQAPHSHICALRFPRHIRSSLLHFKSLKSHNF